MMQQMLLDLGPPPAPTFDNFVASRSAAALAALRAVVAGQGERSLHLWGEPGCGRTHLLRALGAHSDARYIACGSEGVPDFNETVRIWCVDDVELCDADNQIRLFNLINASRARPGGSIITSASAAPLHLALPAEREDLRTRLGWGPVYRLELLTDPEKQAALEQHAAGRGLVLSVDVGRYLINHFSRDMPSLMQLVDTLDRYALKQHRQITLPLIREYEQQERIEREKRLQGRLEFGAQA